MPREVSYEEFTLPDFGDDGITDFLIMLFEVHTKSRVSYSVTSFFKTLLPYLVKAVVKPHGHKSLLGIVAGGAPFQLCNSI